MLIDDIIRICYGVLLEVGATRESITKQQVENLQIILPMLELQKSLWHLPPSHQIKLFEFSSLQNHTGCYNNSNNDKSRKLCALAEVSMITNFTYLKNEPKSFCICKCRNPQQKIILADPEASIINSRRAMEFAIKWISYR